MRFLPLLMLLLSATSVTARAADTPPAIEIVELPRVQDWVSAPFPEDALADGIEEHRTLLRVSIDAEGTVVAVEILELDAWGFDIAARDAVRRMRFTPALSADGPVPATFDFAYSFRLEEQAEDPQAPPPVTLDGVVREAGTRAQIGSARVEVSWDGEGSAPAGPFLTVTSADGSFEIAGVPPGAWSITVLGPVHLPLTERVEIVEGEVTSAGLWLRTDRLADNEITVYGERPKEPEITRRTLTSQEIRRVPGTFGDPVKVIQTLPGAARSPFGTGLLIIRGANPEDSGVYIDGIEVPLIYHLTGTTSVISPELVDSVDYLPGGYAARFGRTSAGTIDVNTKNSIDETRISAGADVLDAQVYAQTRIPVGDGDRAWGVAVAARRSYIDAFLPLVLRNATFRISPRYWDYQTKIIAPTAPSRRISLFVYGFEDVLTIASDQEQAQGSDQDTQGDLLTRYLSHRAILSWTESLSSNLELRNTLGVGLDRTVFGVGSAFTFDGGSTNAQLRSELAWSPSKSITITPGVDALGGTWSFAFRAPLRLDDLDNPIGERDPIGFDGNGTAWYPDPWLRLDLRPLKDKERLLITPSFRANNVVLTYAGEVAQGAAPLRRTAFDPRVAGRFAVTPNVAVKGSTGLYHQPPQPQESIGLGQTPDLGYERAWNSSVGIEHTVSPAVEWELELFWRDTTRLIDVNDGFSGFGSQVFANVGLGRAYGAELIARHQPVGRFFGWISYTLSRSERKANARADWLAFDFDQTHIISAQGGYDLPYDTGVSLQIQYVTGNPQTPLNAGVLDVDQGLYNGFTVGQGNSTRLPDFFQTSLRFDKRFTFKSWELEAYVDLLNLVRGVNPEFTIYNFDFAETAYVRGLPFIPNVGLEARVRR